MVTVRCMTILGDAPEILLVLKNSKNAITRARAPLCVWVCARAQFWGKIILLIFGMVADSIHFIQSPKSKHSFCLWSIIKDGVTTLCCSTALCQSEHPVRCHLNQSCKTCVSFLSVPTKGDLDDIKFKKVSILPDLGNWWRNMYLCVFSKFWYITTSYR